MGVNPLIVPVPVEWWRVVRASMAEPPGDLHFTLASVDLGDGASSAVLHETDAPERAQKLTQNKKLALDTYVTAACESGVWDDGTFQGVSLEDWRAAFYAKHTGDTGDAKKKAFQRVRSALQEFGTISVSDDIYMIHDAARQMQIVMHRDKRDIPGQNQKCPGAEAGLAGTNGTRA